MITKIPCGIRKIVLDSATFAGTGEYVEPTYVNFFFGNNGTGKSTVAQSIKSGAGVSYAPGRTAADYNVLLYDQDYINDNMRSYHELPSVFTMASENVEIQKQIDQKAEEQGKARQAASEAGTEKKKKEDAQTAVTKQFHKDCWDLSEDLRTDFPLTQDGFKNSKQKFANEVRRHQPAEHDKTELKRKYDSAYSSTAKTYVKFTDVSDVDALENVEGREILSEIIVNSAETELAKFWKKIGASEWIQSAHAEYHEKAEGKCPYCSRDLVPDFEEQFIASFDDHYQKSKAKLDAFLNAYRDKANEIVAPLQRTPVELYPEIDKKAYDDKLAAVKALIAENIGKIKEKVAEPSKKVELEDASTLLQELQDIIDGYNKLIQQNNDIVAAGPKKKNECKNEVFETIAFALKQTVDAYNRSMKDLDDEIQAQQKIITAQDGVITRLNGEIRDLNAQTADTTTAMENINQMLEDSGFQGFKLRARAEEETLPDGRVIKAVPAKPRNYEVIRTDTNKVAERLSEGEKNFIAFMYFQQQVFGKETADDTRMKIVVIDDPVSSMDSSTLFIVGAAVRNMIEICRNNADNRNPVSSQNFIKQIFILTHNPYFHRDVTYAYVKRYEYASYYLVQKFDNRSSITHCVKQNPDIPSEKMNYNPVKNAYAALWDEYKEVTSGIALMNVIRRILEYYFLQLSGLEGSTLRQRILVDHKYDFTHDEAGNEDDSKYRMASTMLSYIQSSNGSIIDGVHYILSSMDLDVCRKTFRMIFETMGQKEHYKMMMGII